MIRVTVELLPLGREPGEHLGTMTITNDGTGSRTTGNYRVQLSRKGAPSSEWKTGEVREFKRKQQGVYDLMLLALDACIGDRRRE